MEPTAEMEVVIIDISMQNVFNIRQVPMLIQERGNSHGLLGKTKVK